MADATTDRYHWRMLCQGVPSFRREVIMVPAVVEVCSEATQDWASKTLGAMQLKRAEWIPSGEDAWDLFVNYGKGLTLEAGANENAPLPIRRHFQVNYPRTKADVNSALDVELLDPVWGIMGDVLQGATPINLAFGLGPTMEIFREITMARTEQDGQMDVGMNHTFAATVWSEMDRPDTIDWLERDKIWSENDQIRPKAMVDVQVKHHRSISQERFRKFAEIGANIGAPDDDRGVTGVRAMLQQAVYNSHDLGTPYVCIADYETLIMMRVPRIIPGSVRSPGKVQTIDWAIVPREHARKALAFLLFLAKQNMDDAFNGENESADE